jgi:ABC-type nitrate/sulfonate/bicarbonate transport system permease component
MADPKDNDRQAASNRLAETLRQHGVPTSRQSVAGYLFSVLIGVVLGLLLGWLLWG